MVELLFLFLFMFNLDLKEVNRKLNRDLEQTKGDCHQMLKIMEENENKIAVFEEKERGVRSLAIDSKRKIEEALLHRDQALLKEKQYERQISRLQQLNKEDAANRQAKYDTLVEKY